MPRSLGTLLAHASETAAGEWSANQFPSERGDVGGAAGGAM